MWNQHFSEFSY